MRKIRIQIVAVTLVIFAVSAADAADRKPSWFEGMYRQPAITPAVPANYIIVSLSPETKKTKVFHMDDGVLWAPERTARHFEFRADNGGKHDDVFKNAEDPLFYVFVSDDVFQEQGTDKFNIDEVFKHTKSPELKKAKMRKAKWGAYPVISITGEISEGPVFIAWLGVNSPNETVIQIEFRVPKGKGHPTEEEKKIWEKFLNETKRQK